jgi:hypothetical protein
MIDAMWGLIDPKSHDKYAASTFNDINKVAQVGTQMGGWNAMGQMGQQIAGRPTQQYLQPQQQQQQ